MKFTTSAILPSNVVSVMLFLAFAPAVAAQAPDPRSDTRGAGSTQIEDIQRRRTEGAAIREALAAPYTSPLFERRPEQKRKAIEKLEIALMDGDVSSLRAPDVYRERFIRFLQDNKAAIARIYPDQNCHETLTISVAQAERCESLPYISGNGSFYSFRLETNLNESNIRGFHGDWADIKYAKGRFHVGSSNIQGLIAEISNVPINSLDVDKELIKEVMGVKVSPKIDDFKRQRSAIEAGLEIRGRRFFVSAPATLNSTYLLRSTAFRTFRANLQLTSEQKHSVSGLLDDFDLRVDTVIIFRVVGQEPDGSLIILWKRLVERDAPTIKS